MANPPPCLLASGAGNSAGLLAHHCVAVCGARRRIKYTPYSAPRLRLVLRSSGLPSIKLLGAFIGRA